MGTSKVLPQSLSCSYHSKWTFSQLRGRDKFIFPQNRLLRTCWRLWKPVSAGFERGWSIFAFSLLTQCSPQRTLLIYCTTSMKTFSGITVPKLLKGNGQVVDMMTSKNNAGESWLSWLLEFHRALAIKRFRNNTSRENMLKHNKDGQHY